MAADCEDCQHNTNRTQTHGVLFVSGGVAPRYQCREYARDILPLMGSLFHLKATGPTVQTAEHNRKEVVMVGRTQHIVDS